MKICKLSCNKTIVGLKYIFVPKYPIRKACCNKTIVGLKY